MRKIIIIFLFLFQIIAFAQNPLNVVITGYCSQHNGSYSYIGLLNGKNNYTHTYIDEDGDPWTTLIGYDNTNWILYEIDFIDIIGFTNPNVTTSLTPPLTGWIPVECEPDATMTVTTALSVNQNQAFTNSTTIFPNPALDFIIVQNKNQTNENFNFQIMDVSGRIIQNNEQNFGDNIDIQTLNAGHYIITIQNSKGNKTGKKFIKK